MRTDEPGSVPLATSRRWTARPSVRLRVTSVATLLMCIAFAITAVSAARLLHRSLAGDYDAQLVDRIDEVELLIDAGALGPIIAATGKETGQVQVIDQGGAVVAASPGLADTSRLDAIDTPPMGRQQSATVDGSRVDGRAGEQFRVVARTVASAHGPLTIYGATSLRAAQRADEHLSRALMVLFPLLAVLAAALIWWVVGRALAPVDAMRGVVDRIGAADLGERVDVGQSQDEIGRLGVTLNRMLDRLDDSTERQRLFAAAASHELRSPLSALRTELEVALAYPDRTDWELVATESLIEIERLERLARELLELTQLRAETRPPSLTQVDLMTLVESELTRRAALPTVTRRAELTPAAIRADRDVVVRLLRNLLDNAERHAASELQVTVSREDGMARLRVWNDGSPIAAEDRERIFDPFTRLDDARVLDAGGAGLGLAIARGLTDNLGGRLVLVDSDTGAAFEATFPAA